ncbi:hypothetical protein [Streptomyces xanthophaeus]|uniref:hypothetical protein n=1 Tax=Streptomyces xanthophaeus TaxID=67385 RepID=UPI002647262D|nr:hypothetical protein [Streptomyces xanthophaeus]WKD36520.1 hypothetical protein KO717_34365 [Streptomyces xanthophaeus]
MTADEPHPAEEQRDGRVAGGCVLAVALAAGGTIAYAVPESAYFVAGLLATRAAHKAQGLAARFRRPDDEPEPEPVEVDIVAKLQSLAEGGEHVRLTQLQEATGLPDTGAVRALLDEAGVRVRSGVRAGGKNGPGVHHEDVPPLPGAGNGAPSGGCLCSSAANTNANNGPSREPGEGLRVERIGQSGSVIRVPGERRAYTV